MPWGGAALGGCRPTDHLDWASELLLLPPEADLWGGTDGGDLFESGLGVTNNLNSIIIQDCMWSGFSAREKLERAVSEKLQGKPPATTTTAAPPPPPPAAATTALVTASTVPAVATAECVDPAVVFPFPVTKREATVTGTSRGVVGGGGAPRGARSPRPAGDSRASSSSSGDDTLSDSGECMGGWWWPRKRGRGRAGGVCGVWGAGWPAGGSRHGRDGDGDSGPMGKAWAGVRGWWPSRRWP